MNVLQISTYPIVRPLHGGQIRVKEIREELANLGHEIRSISFSEFSHQYYDDELDFKLSDTVLNRIVKTPFSNDLATALESEKSKGMHNFLKKHLLEFKPDYIFLEQPWLWPLVKNFLEEGLLVNTQLVYSSQNIEYLTKKSIFESNKIVDTCDVINSIKKLESDLCNHASVVIGCTQTDLDEFAKLGAKKLVLCPNGITTNTPTTTAINKIKHLIGKREYALFVGSAYPPNAQGFWAMLGNSMAWLNPDQMIIAVGGCSLILEDFAPEQSRIYDFVNFDRIKRLGFVENDELAALIDGAKMLILPITSGGGSNLKTAEAIMSCKPVVATEKACRGFDLTNKLSNFEICYEQSDFIDGIKKAFDNPCSSIGTEELNLRESVLWKNTLERLDTVFDMK